MNETTICPGCQSAIATPTTRMKRKLRCPSCRRVFVWASTAVTDTPRKSPLSDSAVTKQPKVQIRLRPNGHLCCKWFALAARLILAANVAAFLFPMIFYLWETWLFPSLVHGDGRGDRLVENAATLLILVTTVPAIFAVSFWYLAAIRDGRLIAAGLKCSLIPPWISFFLPIYVLFIPICVLAVVYRNLNELWQASDPDELDEPESWKQSEPGCLVQTWGISLLYSGGLIAMTVLFQSFLLLCFASFSIAVTGVLLSIVIKSITDRQHERYRQLFEDMSVK